MSLHMGIISDIIFSAILPNIGQDEGITDFMKPSFSSSISLLNVSFNSSSADMLSSSNLVYGDRKGRVWGQGHLIVFDGPQAAPPGVGVQPQADRAAEFVPNTVTFTFVIFRFPPFI